MIHKNALINRIFAQVLVCAYSLLLLVGSVHSHHQHFHTDLCKVSISEKEHLNLHAGYGDIQHCYVQNAFSGSTDLFFKVITEIPLPLNTDHRNFPEISACCTHDIHLNNPLRAPPSLL